MPEYLAPGVYVEEIEIGAKPIEGVSTSTAGFLGQTERGPLEPRLVTGFEEFQKLYGGYIAGSYLAYGIDGFFRNGGKRCYMGRILADDSVTAEAPIGPLTIQAIGPGEWDNRIAVKIGKGTLVETGEAAPWNKAKLIVMYWKKMPPVPVVDPTNRAESRNPDRREPTILEVYDNISPDPGSSDFYEKRINGLSQLIRVRQDNSDGLPDQDLEFIQTLGTAGADGSAIDLGDYKGREITDNFFPTDEVVKRTGLKGFEEVDEIAILCAPNENSVPSLRDELIYHCEDLKDRFAILQAAQGDTDVGSLDRPADSKYAAFYSPWIKVFDPLTNTNKLIPPGGHIAGVYARSDIERGVHKAPANEVLKGVTELQLQITKEQQGILNPKGINCIRAFPGRGIRVWGARTISSDTLWKYINVRRLFLFLEESIDEGTQWVVFEPNNEKLWARVRQTITQFLTRVWKDGALMGTTPEEAFFVKCDRTTMTQDDLDNGRLIVLIGVAPVKPAEFVIFRIAQWAGGSAATE
ncbi:MAG: phage tail sheath family protein [Proteobacteria bacterium]|nr:phage tail sheath family protein [Pseudomonadota bacterium]